MLFLSNFYFSLFQGERGKRTDDHLVANSANRRQPEIDLPGGLDWMRGFVSETTYLPRNNPSASTTLCV